MDIALLLTVCEEVNSTSNQSPLGSEQKMHDPQLRVTKYIKSLEIAIEINQDAHLKHTICKKRQTWFR